jgi:hypothetical protein
MAYNAFPRSAQKLIPAPPQVGADPTRTAPISQPRSWRSGTAGALPKGSVGESDQSVAAASALLRFLVLLVIMSGLTCLYVWQANTISAIKGNTQTMLDEIQNLDRQNVNLMLKYTRWDAPGYIEAESSRSGMVVGQAPVRVQLPAWSQGDHSAEDHADPIGQLAALLPSSLTVGSQPK